MDKRNQASEAEGLSEGAFVLNPFVGSSNNPDRGSRQPMMDLLLWAGASNPDGRGATLET